MQGIALRRAGGEAVLGRGPERRGGPRGSGTERGRRPGGFTPGGGAAGDVQHRGWRKRRREGSAQLQHFIDAWAWVRDG